MWGRISAIATNTFREAIRNKILYILLAFAVVMIAFSLVLSALSIGQDKKIIQDVGLFSITFFGVLIAIMVGIGLIYNELDKRTIYVIISKPIHRYEFVLGKFMGLVLTILVNVLFMSLVFFGLLYIMHIGVSLVLVQAILMTCIELIVVTALATLFSSFSTPILSSVYTFMLFIAGHLSDDLIRFAAQMLKATPERTVTFTNIAMAKTAIFISWVLPQLEKFNIRNQAVNLTPITDNLMLNAAYGILYTGCVLFIASVCFSKRNFK
jgi:ABC-type transport system involved in multi-copper enzyme maturation permease subunit